MATTEAESESDSYEFITGKDAAVKTDDVHFGRSSSLDSGVPLNRAETFLAKRVRDLKQENDELRRAIQGNDEALKLCLKNLNTWKGIQESKQKDLVEKHGKAKNKVKELQDKNAELCKELEENIKRVNAAEKNKINAENENQQHDTFESLEKENATLKLTTSALKTNVGSLREHVKQIMNLPDGNFQRLVAPGSSFLQDLVKVCQEVDESIDLVVNQPGNGPPSVQPKEATNLHQLNSVLQEELQVVKANYDALKEKVKQSEGEQQSSGFYHKNRGVDVKELEDEVNFLGIGVDKMDMVRAGCVSHGSEATEESFLHVSQGRQLESVESTGSLSIEAERRYWKEANEKLQNDKVMMGKSHIKIVENWEKALAEKNALAHQLEVNKNEKSIIVEELQDVKAKNEVLENEISKKDDVDLLQALEEKQREQEKLHREILTLKFQVCSFNEEIQEKEKLSDQWFHQGIEMQDRIKHVELILAKREEDLKLKESVLLETRNELHSVYKKNEKLLDENQHYRGVTGVEVSEYNSKIDSLTAQLFSAEEMVENKEQDYRKLQQDHANLTCELETIPLLKQQIEVFQTDFETEKQARQKREEECKRMREELNKLRNENAQMIEELNDPSDSSMAEMQRRHGCPSMQVGNNQYECINPWSGLYDGFLAPRGPAGRGNFSASQRQIDSDLNRQVSGGRCPRCQRMFPDLDTLQIHAVQCLESENTSTTPERVCPKCQDVFPDLDTLQIHVMECIDN